MIQIELAEGAWTLTYRAPEMITFGGYEPSLSSPLVMFDLVKRMLAAMGLSDESQPVLDAFAEMRERDFDRRKQEGADMLEAFGRLQ